MSKKTENLHIITMELLQKDFVVSYSSVCRYVRRKKSEKTAKPKDVYLRIHREPGLECEFDWDKVLCSALVDRLCHKAHMVNIT